jgi:phage protein U
MFPFDSSSNSAKEATLCGRRRLGPSTDTSSLIGGIEGDERWKTTAQLQAEGAPTKKVTGKKLIKSAGAETFEFGITPIERLRKQLHQRGASGIIGLSRRFKSIDDDGSNSISQMEFRKALKESGLDFTEPEIVELFNIFDVDKSGSIGLNEFLVRIQVK